jgi:hypothetical protein
MADAHRIPGGRALLRDVRRCKVHPRQQVRAERRFLLNVASCQAPTLRRAASLSFGFCAQSMRDPVDQPNRLAPHGVVPNAVSFRHFG